MPAMLLVPSDVPTDSPVPGWLPPGTVVRLGMSLLEKPWHSRSSPVAPGDGVVGQAVACVLVGGRSVHAVELHPKVAPDARIDDDDSMDAVPPPARSTTSVLESVTSADLGDWLTRLQAAGVSADRWTCPDLIGQLRDALTRPVDTLLANLLDSDPWLPISRVVCNSEARAVAVGLGLLGRLTGARNWWAMIEQADDLEPALRAAAVDVASNLRIAPLENDYPQLDPSLLVRSTTGRRLRPGRLPTSQGVLVLDAPAAAAIGRFVLADVPMTRTPLVVYDQPADRIYALSVPVGTTAGHLLQALEIPVAVREVYAGGPLRQILVGEGQVIGGGELTLFAAPPQPAVVAEPCIRCGWCVEACPTRCRPAGLLEAAQQRDGDLARHNGLDSCIECGLCTFVCPSRLPLLQGIRQFRHEIAEGSV